MVNWDEIESVIFVIEIVLGEGKFDKYLEFIGKYQIVCQFVFLIIKGFNFKGVVSVVSFLWVVDLLCIMFEVNKCSLFDNLLIGFIWKVWCFFVFLVLGEINWCVYELCVYFELCDCFWVGDVWVEGSWQCCNFDDCFIFKVIFEILCVEGLLLIVVVEIVEIYFVE